VGTASMLVARQMLPLLDAVATVRDADLFDWCARLWRAQGLRLEPSAAAGFAALAPATAALALPPDAIQVVWTTGGGLLPDEPFGAVLAMAGDPGLAGA
jgi:D-serine dehydratase